MSVAGLVDRAFTLLLAATLEHRLHQVEGSLPSMKLSSWFASWPYRLGQWFSAPGVRQ